MFGDDDLESRMKEVREEWQEAVSSVAGEEYHECMICAKRGRPSQFGSEEAVQRHILDEHGGTTPEGNYEAGWERTSIVNALESGVLSRTQLAGYMLAALLLLLVIMVAGPASWITALVYSIVGGYLVWSKGQGGNNLALLLGVAMLIQPSVFLLTVIGFNVALMAALLGIAGFVLAGVESPAKRELGPFGDFLFQTLSAIITPIWLLSLINVVLSILTVNFLSLGFLAMVVAAVGTSTYLFSGGNIADAIGVYRGLGLGLTKTYERIMLGHEARGTQHMQVVASTVGSLFILLYALLVATNPQALPQLLGRNPVFPFIIALLGPLAFWHFLSRAEELWTAGRHAAAGSREDAYPGGGAGGAGGAAGGGTGAGGTADWTSEDTGAGGPPVVPGETGGTSGTPATGTGEDDSDTGLGGLFESDMVEEEIEGEYVRVDGTYSSPVIVVGSDEYTIRGNAEELKAAHKVGELVRITVKYDEEYDVEETSPGAYKITADLVEVVS